MKRRERGMFTKVLEYFGGDAKKTKAWFATPNPGLGNISPDEMIAHGRAQNLQNFIDAALGEGHETP